ncbi:FadR/GntR family transcriptional regulator [Limobrevibacterium gyesilva]|uniref:FadR family transcriptional regulator n=1 Tax=Limobrevibacterium gyesilva TaxID=2991712 RepID=A0AA41YN34_9PROT|nr:FadR family transcriptional regulator [Limobrevibacterium gyesilva]
MEKPQITRPEDACGKGFDKVFAFLREQFLAGAIKPGDRLTPERELCQRLGVSRPVLREALRALAMIGVVEILHGVGTIVRRPDVSVLGEFFAFALAQRADMTDDVMQARIAIECQAIRLACQRATLADIERLRGALDHIRSTIDDPTAGAEADHAFHDAMVRASKSETLLCLYQAMGEVLRQSHRDRRDLVRRYGNMKDHVAQDHERLFQAIVARDERNADDILRKHFAIGDEYRRRAALADPSAPT